VAEEDHINLPISTVTQKLLGLVETQAIQEQHDGAIVVPLPPTFFDRGEEHLFCPWLEGIELMKALA
jgi:hypothetical protein